MLNRFGDNGNWIFWTTLWSKNDSCQLGFLSTRRSAGGAACLWRSSEMHLLQGVQYSLSFLSQNLVVYWIANMPFLYSHVEYCDKHFVYGFCNGDSRASVEEYRRRFPDRRIPSRRVFYSNSPNTAGQWLFSKCFSELWKADGRTDMHTREHSCDGWEKSTPVDT